MVILGKLMLLLGLFMCSVAVVWIVCLIFSDSISWGVCCMALWPLMLLYICLNWDECKYAACLLAGSIVLIGGGATIAYL